jgi:hypothetical protein
VEDFESFKDSVRNEIRDLQSWEYSITGFRLHVTFKETKLADWVWDEVDK